jgi:formylglycine-generating enzyme
MIHIAVSNRLSLVSKCFFLCISACLALSAGVYAKQGKAIKTNKVNAGGGHTSESHAAIIKNREPQIVFVKGGSFVMGNNEADDPAERPEHTVELDDFWIGKYEVTVAEFRKFMDSHTYKTDAEKDGFSFCFNGKDLILQVSGVTWECGVYGKKHVNEENHPVIHVSHKDALNYCKWLSAQTGKHYRLLTEAEWEYAARGGNRHDKYIYSGSDDLDHVGWYVWNSDLYTHPVGRKAPNGLGIYDMSGNAWEWCADYMGPYAAGRQTNPHGPDTGSNAVMRGGGWRFEAFRARCTERRGMPPAFNGSGPGFRVARSVK